MSKKVFVSYRHAHREWVFDNLVPCLWAGGAEVLIDRNYFEAGKEIKGQGDALQDRADVNLLVFTKDYFDSEYCQHEMKRALERDPDFTGKVVAVKIEDCDVPDELKSVLYLDLFSGSYAGQWQKLLAACGADLGTDAEHWLAVRNEIRLLLKRNQSVNLVVNGKPKWRQMIRHLRDEHLSDLGIVDLDDGATVPREDLVAALLRACGITTTVPEPPKDLVVLARAIADHKRSSRIALEHFDHVLRRNYGDDLLFALRNLITDSRKLVLLAHSHQPFVALLPQGHEFASTEIFTLVELKGRK
jgi:hypothetical protein